MADVPVDAEAYDLTTWIDPVVGRIGYPHDHPYVESHWLPVLGPTATWLYRRLASELATHPEGMRVDGELLAAALGVPRGGGRRGAFGRGLQRCVMFGLVRPSGANPVPVLAVRSHVPPLSRRHLERLSAVLHGPVITLASSDPVEAGRP